MSYIVSSGFTSTGIVLQSNAMTVLGGGSAEKTTVDYSGSLAISSGGIATTTTVNSRGRATVSSGGTADGITVNPGGSLTVSDGTATAIRENGGYVVAMGSNAILTFIPTVLSNYLLDFDATLHSGTTAVKTQYNSLSIASGGILEDAKSIVGSLCVLSGGTANRTIISGGTVTISSGGTANGTVVNVYLPSQARLMNGTITVSSGATANGTVIKGFNAPIIGCSGGIMNLQRGTTASNTSVCSGGVLNISGKAYDTVVEGYGYALTDLNMIESGVANVVGGGTASGVTVNMGGQLNVKGGTATGIVENGGYVDVGEGAAQFVSNTFSGLLLSNGLSATVHSGTTAADIAVSNGGLLQIFSGGKLTGRIAQIGGVVSALSGAIVDFDLTGTAPGAAALFNNLSGITGSPVYTLTVNAGQAEGLYTLAEGAETFEKTITVVNTVGDTLGTLVVGETVAISGVDYTLALSDGTLSLQVGAGDTPLPCTSSGTAVLSGGAVTIGDTESYRDTVVFAGGSLCVDSGGTARRITVHTGGNLIVSSGGTAVEIVQNGGHVEIQSGAEATFAPHVYYNSTFSELHSGTTAVNAKVMGSVYIYEGGVADGLEVVLATRQPLDSFTVFLSGGTANRTELVNPFCRMYVCSGGLASGTLLTRQYNEAGGRMYVSSGGTAVDTVIDGLASMTVSSGGTAVRTRVAGSFFVSSGATATEIVENGGWVDIASGKDTTVTFASNTFTGAYVYSASIHSGTTAFETQFVYLGKMVVFSGGVASNTTISSNGSMIVSSGGTAAGVTVSTGRLVIAPKAVLTGRVTIERGASVSMNGTMNFNLAEAGTTPLVNDLSLIRGGNKTLTVTGAEEYGVYSLANGLTSSSFSLTVVDAEGNKYGTLSFDQFVVIGDTMYTLVVANRETLSVVVGEADLTPTSLAGTENRVSWKMKGPSSCTVEYSTDDFGHVLSLETDSTGQDLYGLPAGTYQWRVMAETNSDWAVGNEIVSDNDPAWATVLESEENGCDDVFFATANDTWSRLYYAKHVGEMGVWTGTNELVSAKGKGRIQNLFFGSDDPNVLCLTDGENGDAIFLDDMYTELPDEIEENTARLLQIREIRAGAGDDIVDMTSQQFACIGGGQTIRGGDGNDTIWANTGENMLFGDAGNDRIVGASGADVIAGGIGRDSLHGGGGSDVFAFCDNWGTDTVEQLETGTVTLWFVSGSESNWDEATLTYRDGDNTVTVSGVDADRIVLKFGDDGSGDFKWMSDHGMFDAFTSRNIFEAAAQIADA